MQRLALDGTWQYRLRDGERWRPIPVPGCWEAHGVPVGESGPVVYRRELEVPADWRGKRLWLRFEGVSYHCTVRVDGALAGAHTGIWDPMLLEVTHLLTPGARAEVSVEVVKPAGLAAGPDSAALPGPFPLRETLSGFLPYVWGHIFGGIWQSVFLEATAGAHATEVFARGAADGGYELRAALSDPARLELRLRDAEGRLLACHHGGGASLEAQGRLEAPGTWGPEEANLYELEVVADGDAVARRRFGFRSLARDGATLTLNGDPVYPRLILNWGWYPRALHSNPGRERVRADFERLRALGFNGVKYCLWVPPDYVLDLADEMGMLVWLELPMWLPRTSEDFLARAPGEYERIVRRVRSHPSIVVYSLGCELSSEVGAGLLERLYEQTKALTGDALLRDNSGSGEAYGGLLNEYADYYDYHFYSELPAFRPLLDYFAPRWRPRQPFLFGEYCDSDTFRDLRRTDAQFGGRPWWAGIDPQRNPQGARWQFDLPWLQQRLERIGFWERGDELEGISRRQALLQRKFTLEATRTYREVSGYVVTGEVDTPISTSGVFDDAGEPKFDAGEFRQSNDDSVLALGWDKRRAWIRGGDRAAYWDPYGYRGGERVRAHLILSHYGAERGRAAVDWLVTLSDGATVARGAGESGVSYAAGTVREALIAEFEAPELDRPVAATLRATARIGARTVSNSWPLWFFPRHRPDAFPAVGLYDPEGVLEGLGRIWPGAEAAVGAGPAALGGARVAICTEWSDRIAADVRAGGRALLLLRGRADDPLPSVALPFWREAVKVLEPHPAWGDFPHEGWTDLQFLGVSADRALDASEVGEHRPILRRVDARTAALHDYATTLPYGRGLLLATTLRFGGGIGEQPLGIARNVCGQELLRNWVRWLETA